MSDEGGRRRLAEAVVASLDLTVVGDGAFEGVPPRTFGPRTFGGQVVAMAVVAAMRCEPAAGAPHSLHGYFLRPVAPELPVRLHAETIREGRSFQTVELRMNQQDRPAFVMTAQFHADEPGPDYQPAMPDVPGPAELPEQWPHGPIEVRVADLPRRDDGTYAATRRAWMRTRAGLPDDPAVHAAMAAYVSDMTGNGARPLSIDEWDGYTDASLDHALWFHRPIRVDDWAFFDVHCDVNHAGRSLIRGSMYDGDGRLCLSMAQEMLIRPTGQARQGRRTGKEPT
jgi:acyl-CoA thioesterase II